MRTTLAAALVIIFASVIAMPNSALGEPVTLNYAVTVNELFRYTPISTTPIDPVSFSMTVTLDDQVLRTFTDAVGNRFTFFSAPSFSGVPLTTFRTRLGTPAVPTAGHRWAGPACTVYGTLKGQPRVTLCRSRGLPTDAG